jgi:hypothetical protein
MVQVVAYPGQGIKIRQVLLLLRMEQAMRFHFILALPFHFITDPFSFDRIANSGDRWILGPDVVAASRWPRPNRDAVLLQFGHPRAPLRLHLMQRIQVSCNSHRVKSNCIVAFIRYTFQLPTPIPDEDG